MEDKMFRFKFIVLTIIVLVIGIIAAQPLYEDKKPIVAMSRENYEIQTRTIDSLQNVIGNLQSEIHMLEDGFDTKEHRYEDIIDEYELGLSYLRDYHPKSYKDFHRIVGFKERYSFELEKENIKRLKLEKWD
jgi:coenzyme F420-reducing hydrogenase alpha subunit